MQSNRRSTRCEESPANQCGHIFPILLLHSLSFESGRLKWQAPNTGGPCTGYEASPAGLLNTVSAVCLYRSKYPETTTRRPQYPSIQTKSVRSSRSADRCLVLVLIVLVKHLRAIAENWLTLGERFGSVRALQFSSACGGGHDRGRSEEEASSRCARLIHQQALKCVQVTGAQL